MEQWPCKVTEVKQPIPFLSFEHKNQDLISKLWNQLKCHFQVWHALSCLYIYFISQIIDQHLLRRQHCSVKLELCVEEHLAEP